MNLENKRIVLTGASLGIGKELLSLLIKFKGIRIIAVARNIEPIKAIENVVYPFSADVSTNSGVDSVFSYAQEIFGEIDLFIANAGFAYIEKLEKPDWKHIEEIFALNVYSPIYSLEKLVEKSLTPKHFVCIVSGVALISLPHYALYCSTKAALRHFMDTYRYEKPNNLTLTTVYPVATKTSFFDKSTGRKATPLPYPSQQPSVVAKAILNGIRKDKQEVFLSFFFRFVYPLVRIFPFMLKQYSLSEKRKIEKMESLRFNPIVIFFY